MSAEHKNRNSEPITSIKRILENRGMKQCDLARLLKKKEPEVSRWLSGTVAISKRSRRKIEEALGEPITKDSTFKRTNDIINIGIIGTGNIAGRFVAESRNVKGINIIAVFNPNINEAISFCEKFGISKVCCTVEDLFSVSDAIYVASPVSSHYSYAAQALIHGCHVLCEIPFVSSNKEALELINLSRNNGLILMNAIKTAYCPSFQQMIMLAKSGIIGDVVDISASVTNLLPDFFPKEFSNERMMENMSYPLLVFFKLFGTDVKRIHSFRKWDGDKLKYTNTSVEFEGGIGSFKVGVGVKSEGSMIISGTKGYLYVPAPWWKPDYFEIRFENPADNKKYYFPYEADGLRYEIQVLKDKINRNDNNEYISVKEIKRITHIQSTIMKE